MENLGYDRFFERVKMDQLPESIQKLEPGLMGDFIYKITFLDRTLWAIETIFDLRPLNIHSRATQVWRAYDEKNVEVALRIAWCPQSPGQETSYGTLQEIRNKLFTLSSQVQSGETPISLCPTERSAIVREFQTVILGLLKENYESCFLIPENEVHPPTPIGPSSPSGAYVPADSLFPPERKTKQMPALLSAGRTLTTKYLKEYVARRRAGVVVAGPHNTEHGPQDDQSSNAPPISEEWSANVNLLVKEHVVVLLSMDNKEEDGSDENRSDNSPSEEDLDTLTEEVQPVTSLRTRHVTIFSQVCYRPTQLSKLLHAFQGLEGCLYGRYHCSSHELL